MKIEGLLNDEEKEEVKKISLNLHALKIIQDHYI